MVDTRLLRANINLLPHHLLVASLPELPWEIVATAVQLQVLVSLKSLIADFTYETVGGHEGLWRQCYHFRIWI